MTRDRDIELFETLAGQTALVTGSSRGLGAEIASQLSHLGATVYASARQPGDVDVPSHRSLQLDVTDESEIATAVETIDEAVGSLDILVNNAGVHGPEGSLKTVDTTAITDTLDVNLAGPILLARQCLSLLERGTAPRVVNIASSSGQFDGDMEPTHLPYSVSKAGLNAFTRTLAAQYPKLCVNSVDPGWVRTDNGGPAAPKSVPEGAATAVWLSRFRDGPSGGFWRDDERIEW